jgi:hypothetical protein
LHQGLMRKSRSVFAVEQAVMEKAQWSEAEDGSFGFTKGSAMLAGDAFGTAEDRFVGFRQRIASKCAWVYGLLLLRQQQCLDELEKLNHNDPIRKCQTTIMLLALPFFFALKCLLADFLFNFPLPLLLLSSHSSTDKVLHRVRPSERERVVHETETEFLATRKAVEDKLEVTVDKLSKWHTYFGMGY